MSGLFTPWNDSSVFLWWAAWPAADSIDSSWWPKLLNTNPGHWTRTQQGPQWGNALTGKPFTRTSPCVAQGYSGSRHPTYFTCCSSAFRFAERLSMFACLQTHLSTVWLIRGGAHLCMLHHETMETLTVCASISSHQQFHFLHYDNRWRQMSTFFCFETPTIKTSVTLMLFSTYHSYKTFFVSHFSISSQSFFRVVPAFLQTGFLWKLPERTQPVM